MTDLSDPAIREAGARALCEFVTRHPDWFVNLRPEWRGLTDTTREAWLSDWDTWFANVLNPIIQMTEIREQLRAGDDPGSEPNNTNPDPASPANAVQEGEE